MKSRNDATPRRLLLGITGGIAAYKSPLLIREFKKAGIEVKPVATRNALEFVTPTTLSALSGEPVYHDTFAERSQFDHIELTRWADALLVAPATANIVAKFAWGVADDLLSTLFTALKRPVILAPAMNHDMWVEDSTQKNLRTLASRGATIIQPGTGSLACGDEGAGRMADIEIIAARTLDILNSCESMRGVSVLVTAGATREPIDPVRFISNRSTGKMGFEVAAAFNRLGADVTLVTGPTDLLAPVEVNVVRVTTAAEMFDAVASRAADSRVIVKAAAVADYTPETTAPEKIKKSGGSKTLNLVRTRDILKHLGENKPDGQVLIGFAAETENLLANAAKKLESKNLDMIVLNDVKEEGCGFGTETNRVMMIFPAATAPPADGEASDVRESNSSGSKLSLHTYPLISKTRVADAIARHALAMLKTGK